LLVIDLERSGKPSHAAVVLINPEIGLVERPRLETL